MLYVSFSITTDFSQAFFKAFVDRVERLTLLGVRSLDNTDTPVGDYDLTTKVVIVFS